jgi:hypothetical protein
VASSVSVQFVLLLSVVCFCLRLIVYSSLCCFSHCFVLDFVITDSRQFYARNSLKLVDYVVRTHFKGLLIRL